LNVYSGDNRANSETLWNGETPIQVRINGSPYWQASGRTFPLVAGAEDPPADPDTDKDKPDGDAPEKWDEDRARRTIEKQREEAKTLRAQLKELDALKAKDAQREREKLSETERLAAEKADLEKKLAQRDAAMRELRTEQVIERAAIALGARKPAIVARLIDRTELKYDDVGNPTNAEDLVKVLLKAEPYLAGRTEDTNGVPPTPRGSGPVSHGDRVKENIAKLAATGDYNPL
jgi:hypothetical protein